MNAKEQLFRELEQVPEPLVAELLDFCLFLKQRHQQQHAIASSVNITSSKKSEGITDFLEQLQTIQAQVPAEEWNTLPHDGSINHDHYLYGTPKIEE